VSARQRDGDADEPMRLFLEMSSLSGSLETKAGGLLRVLFLW
jgi:hypothetical protein